MQRIPDRISLINQEPFSLYLAEWHIWPIVWSLAIPLNAYKITWILFSRCILYTDQFDYCCWCFLKTIFSYYYTTYYRCFQCLVGCSLFLSPAPYTYSLWIKYQHACRITENVSGIHKISSVCTHIICTHTHTHTTFIPPLYAKSSVAS